MARPLTGQVLRMDGGRGGGAFALRFRAYGRRHYVTLGTFAEGWTEDSAQEELTRVIAEVKAGHWRPEGSPLRDVIREVLGDADHELLNDREGLALAVIAHAGEDVLKAEMIALVTALIGKVAASTTRESITSSVKSLDLEGIVKPAGDWKRLADCTVADIDTLAYELELQARDLLNRASEWRGLAAAMREGGCATVAELGAEQAQAAMRRSNAYTVMRNDHPIAA